MLVSLGVGSKVPGDDGTKAWYQSIKSLIVLPSDVGRCRLSGWGQRASRDQWLETLCDMTQNRSQWYKCIHLIYCARFLSFLCYILMYCYSCKLDLVGWIGFGNLYICTLRYIWLIGKWLKLFTFKKILSARKIVCLFCILTYCADSERWVTSKNRSVLRSLSSAHFHNGQ